MLKQELDITVDELRHLVSDRAIKGETSMAPITTAVEGKIKPAVAIMAESDNKE